MIGLVLLVGIVTKNSIPLVDFAVLAMRELSLLVVPVVFSCIHGFGQRLRARPALRLGV